MLGAIAYSMGVIAEFAARGFFEEKLYRTKQKRLPRFVRENRANLRKSPILEEYYDNPEAPIDEKTAKEKVGQMRFEILRLNPDLSREVEVQINRSRLIRVLFFVEVLCIVGVLLHLWRAVSAPLVISLLFLVALLYVNWRAIEYRFDRYCLTVERAYKVLVLDAPGSPQKGA
ncbi:MAG: hypothetical protein HY238_27320 [Acidobacteria bacterium]|nr:hypothetical protein [Acidobacteriota bacterium]